MYPHAFSPINLGGVQIPNRIVRTAHATRLGGGKLSKELIAYHSARAHGGVGLSILEICSVHPSSLGPLNAFDPTLPDGYEALRKSIRGTDMKVFQQIWHAGIEARTLDGGPAWGPSDIPSPMSGKSVPRAMTKMQIDDLIEAFAKSAKLVKECGLDGCEVHGAHGFIIQQFLSPSLNVREDDYGGTPENRMRFGMEVMRAIRNEVGHDDAFAVGIRLSNDTTKNGVNEEENIEFASAMCSENLIDYLSVSQGNNHAFPQMIGGMHEVVGYELDRSVPVGQAVNVPVLVSGRFRTVEEVDQVIRLGQADMVAMTRATLADPDLVSKTKAGKIDEIRPCIACNQGCIGQVHGKEGRLGCAVNAEGGFEAQFAGNLKKQVDQPKKVLVVGGGPAGMEAARVAAERGHNVILAEAMPELGGTLSLAAAAPRRQQFFDILHWLETEIFRLGVDVRRSCYMELTDIQEIEADEIILATGSEPRLDGIQVSHPGEPIEGINERYFVSSNDVMIMAELNARSAVVIDDTGHYEALAVCEKLISKGIRTKLITRHETVAPDAWPSLMAEPALERLAKGEFSYHVLSQVLSVAGNKAVFKSKGYSEPFSVDIDLAVMVSLNRPRLELAESMDAAGVSYSVIGDAKFPAFFVKAIASGYHAGVSV